MGCWRCWTPGHWRWQLVRGHCSAVRCAAAGRVSCRRVVAARGRKRPLPSSVLLAPVPALA
eukprot:4587766-Pyramimonas_sp.AAC.1